MDNVRLLKNLYDAFGRGDIPTVLGAMSPNIKWHQAESNPYMPSGEAWVGPDAVLNNLFMRLGREWEGFAIHPGAFHGAGDSVIVEARFMGTYKETEKRADVQVCHIWDVKDGEVTRSSSTSTRLNCGPSWERDRSPITDPTFVALDYCAATRALSLSRVT